MTTEHEFIEDEVVDRVAPNTALILEWYDIRMFVFFVYYTL